MLDSRSYFARRILPLAMLAALAACKSGDAPIEPPGPTPVATVEVTPSSNSVLEGTTTTLSVVTRAADGTALTGRTVMWTSSDPSIASVSITGGVVMAVRAGTVTITATAENRQGTASINVFGYASLSLQKTSGDAQTGIAGQALADSVRIRVVSPRGAPMANLAVSWSATSGAASPATGTTDASGFATTQWTPAATGNATLTANVGGNRTVGYTASVNAPVACSVTGTATFMNEGPTDYTVFTQAQSTVKAVMLLGDFSDLPATETADAAAATYSVRRTGSRRRRTAA